MTTFIDAISGNVVFVDSQDFRCERFFRAREVVWLLSGGGAKGSFQAGAIAYLGREEQMEDYYPDLIAGTSVGAINSILPAHGWKDRRGGYDGEYINRLIRIWLDLETSTDMYVPSDETKLLKQNKVVK